ncbi:hypothetical protein [Hydrogenophaga sp. RWCD_12]|uniref:hypothetical protein n=1 Tax=Hydrogenophaga sp. RWCD_12 TaxID=3391190 RepID=UPI00398525C7
MNKLLSVSLLLQSAIGWHSRPVPLSLRWLGNAVAALAAGFKTQAKRTSPLRQFAAAIVIAAAMSNSHAQYAGAGPFVRVPAEFDTPLEVYEVPNMPRIRDQKGLGLCQSFSNATILQHLYCKTEKIKNCSEVDSDEEVSPLHLWSYLTPNKKGQELGIRENHTHLNIQDQKTVFNDHRGLVVPINAIANLINAARKKQVPVLLCTEKEFSYDQFAAKFASTKESAKLNLKKMNDVYRTQREKMKPENIEAPVCDGCLEATIEMANQILPRALSVEKHAKVVEQSLRKETFGEFLYSIIFQRCTYMAMPHPRVERFPEVDATSTKNEMKERMIKVLKSGTPVSYGPVCVERSAEDKCGQHNIVVSGYKKAKNSKDEVVELFKVHNSWGQEWQDKMTDGGWVDADALVNNYYKEEVTGSSLFWLRSVE